MVRTQYEKAENLLKTHMKELNGLANYLYDHETITGDEFMGLLEQMKVPAEPAAAAEPTSAAAETTAPAEQTESKTE